MQLRLWLRVSLLCVLYPCVASSSWTRVVSLWRHKLFFFFSLRPSYCKPGSVLTPPGSVDLQLPCLSLMSLQTKTRSRTQFDREEKKKKIIIPAFARPWNIVCFRCKDFGSRLCFFVTCGECCSRSCQTSEDRFRDHTLDRLKVGDVWNALPCMQPHSSHLSASAYLVHPVETNRNNGCYVGERRRLHDAV